METLVSVVMGTYNGEKYLKQQIESILNQTYSNFELIVVDDASTDQTLSILQDYAERDNRIQIYTAEKNIGLVENFERGLILAKGDLIALSDQDDIFREDKIELLVNKLKAFPKRDLVISDLSLIDSNGNKTHDSFWQNQRLNPSAGKPFRRLIYSNFATGCAMMFRRKLLNTALPFPKGILVHDWWIAVVATTKNAGGLCLIRESLTAYRQHGANVIGAKQVYVKKLPTFDKIVSFIKSPAFFNPLALEVRKKESAMHRDRVASYLKSDIWAKSEIKAIEQVISIFDDYASNKPVSFFKRLLVLPNRLYYASLTKRLTPCIGVLYLTFFG
jgi:glycosyltransferase involved in cell wall biosynthesis